MKNRAKPIYDAVSFKELSDEICHLLKPAGVNADFGVVFQTCENLGKCCPQHTGDWYFTGDFPTAGGNRLVNRALLEFVNSNPLNLASF